MARVVDINMGKVSQLKGIRGSTAYTPGSNLVHVWMYQPWYRVTWRRDVAIEGEYTAPLGLHEKRNALRGVICEEYL